MYEWQNSDIELLSQLLTPKRGEVEEVPDEEETISQLFQSERLKEDNTYVGTGNKLNSSNTDNIITEDNSKEQFCKFDENEDRLLCNEERNENWKQNPKFDISYKQTITPSDIYLQFGGRNPSTSSCENMVVKVHLPGQSLQNIDLKVMNDKLEVKSPKFYLNLPLPQKVDPQKGKATFDLGTENLVVNLVMSREFDYINF